ncbi:MAG: methyltransferase domain-containing protein, partial [Bdellovibrionales bacterium]|nr:methyltransferase domain-containing protein [Bdellovibrionales bacterium]
MIREFGPELMDQPGVDPEDYRVCLDGLRRINVLSRVAERFWRTTVRALRLTPGATLRVVDTACGGADVSLRFATLARQAGVRVNVTLQDRSSHALAVAVERFSGTAIPFSTLQTDLSIADLPEEFDVVLNSLFLHHLPEKSVVET